MVSLWKWSNIRRCVDTSSFPPAKPAFFITPLLSEVFPHLFVVTLDSGILLPFLWCLFLSGYMRIIHAVASNPPFNTTGKMGCRRERERERQTSSHHVSFWYLSYAFPMPRAGDFPVSMRRPYSEANAPMGACNKQYHVTFFPYIKI